MPRKSVELPRHIHPVISRGREYFYYQEHRGTPRQGPRIPLPRDPHSPEFWTALRQAQGIVGPVATDTVNALIDAYITAWPALPKKLSDSTQRHYRRYLKIARKAWGELKADGLRPVHVRAMMQQFTATPPKANSFLWCMSALSAWARVNDQISQSFVEGVKSFDLSDRGHKPWTPEQIAVIHALPDGMMRRGLFLYLYTGQRGSDVVRLGLTDIDEGGFALSRARGTAQQKTGREAWCPIVPELAAEMAKWEKRPGPFLLQESGRRYTRQRFGEHFDKLREEIPALADATLHGLRATAVIRLRRDGLQIPQISDIVGMSMQTIERYCRFADKKASGKAALLSLTQRRKKNVEQT
jgi:integrase